MHRFSFSLKWIFEGGITSPNEISWFVIELISFTLNLNKNLIGSMVNSLQKYKYYNYQYHASFVSRKMYNLGQIV